MIDLIAVTCLLGIAHAFPGGAPSVACTDMKPGHLQTSTTGEANPFKLTLSAATYKPGDVIKGTLTSDTDTKFKGFLIQVGKAMNASEPANAIGEFINIDSNVMKNVCGTNGKGGITHVNNQEKSVVNFSWQAPSTLVGELSFRATVVEVYKLIALPPQSRYWMNLFSERVKEG